MSSLSKNVPMLKMVLPKIEVQEHTHSDITHMADTGSKQHCLVLTNTNDVHANLHVERGSDIRSQVVTGDTFRFRDIQM